MLSVLAMIGKILFITVLSLLAIVIALLLIVLLVPVRYRAKGAFDKDTKPNFICDVRATWLLHILSFRFSAKDSETKTSIRIFGIPHTFFLKLKKKKRDDTKPKAAQSETKQSETKQSEIKQTETKQLEDKQSQDKESEAQQSEVPQINEIKSQDNKSKKRDSIIKIVVDKIKAVIDRIKSTIQKLKSLLRDGQRLKKKLAHYYKVLTSDVCKNAFSTCKKRLMKLIKHILPRKGKCHISFGMDDPAVTGNILAIHGILYSVLGDIIILSPSFDEIILKGDFHFKGKIRVGTLLYHVIRVLLDENCKRFYRIIKKEMEHGR